jgi:lipopolysaccharide export LptBFGC system permease protein LptF
VNILQRYILRELSAPVVLSIVFFTVILLLGKLFEMAELLLLARVGWAVAGELIGIVALSLVVLTVPMAVLLGTLSGVGRMTGENEILAMRVGGVALGRVFWPYFIITAIFSCVLMWANWTFIPTLIQKLSERQTEMQFRILTNLEAGRNYDNLAPRGSELSLYFNERAEPRPGDGGYVLRMKQVAMRVVGEAGRLTGAEVSGSAPRTEGAIVEAPRETVFYASEGVIIGDLANRSVTITLSDGTIMPINRLLMDGETGNPIMRETRERETTLRFASMTQRLSPKQDQRAIERMDPRALRVEQLFELTKVEPTGPIRETGKRNRITDEWQTYLNARNELFQRMTLPFSLLAFSLIAVPLAVELRPRARTMSFLLALGVILVYYALNTLANAVGMTNSDYTLALFILPNIVIGGAGIILFWRS